MKKNKIIVLVASVLCISSYFLILLFNNRKEVKNNIDNIDKIDKTSSIEEIDEINENSNEIIIDENIIEESSTQIAPQQEETKQNVNVDTNKKRETNSKNIQTPKQNNNKNEQQPVIEKKEESGVVDSSGNAVKEEQVKTVVKQPWEQIGISEYDWYHRPVYDWMRIDYNISKCGSKSSCESLCMNDAEELAFTENVSCIQVYSHSGEYLGEMLKRG